MGVTGRAHSARAGRERFAFGRNWSRFVDRLGTEQVEEATTALRALTGSLEGRTFLDVGCGSGLHSLAAHNLGAAVHAFDFDADSVSAAESLRARFAAAAGNWHIERGSALDAAYMSRLGHFDVVYSWGVLHHTGDMWRAVDLVAERVAVGGVLVLALYNDQGLQSRAWALVKATYVRVPALRPVLLASCAPLLLGPAIVRDILRGRPAASWRDYKRRRGMSPWTDLVDWVGGYPFEVADAQSVRARMAGHGFVVEREQLTRRLGCNEFVFRRV